LTSYRLMRFCQTHWIDIACLVGCTLVTFILGCVLISARPRQRPLWQGEAGALSEELVLIFPFFLLFLAITIQVIILMNARLVVNYSAFVAGRSASVWIPSSTGSESANSIALSSQSPANGAQTSTLTSSPGAKLDRIRNAAVLACAPISPSYFSWLLAWARSVQFNGQTIGTGSSGINYIKSQLNSVGSIFPQQGAAGAIVSLIPQWVYSSQFTQIWLNDQPNAASLAFAPYDDIKVTVQHDFYLAVPFVGRALSLVNLSRSYSQELGQKTFGLFNVDLYYVPVVESYVFKNDGEQLAPGY